MAGYGTFQDYLSQSALPEKPKTYNETLPLFGRANVPAAPAFYQVKPEDTDLSSVAGNLGVPLPQLVNANDGAKTLPPIGSYIQTQPQGANSFTSPGGVNLQSNPRVQQLINQGVPPNVAAQMASSGPPGSPITQTQPGMAGDRPDLSWIGERRTVMQSLSMGQLPQSISSTAAGTMTNPATGLPFTSQDMIASGYTFNTATGSWVLKPGGATTPGAPQTGNNWQTNPALQMTTWGRGRNKFQTTMKWAQNARRRLRRRDVGQPVEATPASGTGTASTVLEMRLGSG